jgi:Ricin-type beta-trefoil lectin domain
MLHQHRYAQRLFKAIALLVTAYSAVLPVAHADEHLVFRPFIAGEGIVRPGSGERMQIYAKYNPQLCFEHYEYNGPGTYRFKQRKCDTNNHRQYFTFDYSNRFPGTLLIKTWPDGGVLTDNTRGLQGFILGDKPETPDGGAWKENKSQGSGSGSVFLDLTASIQVTWPTFNFGEKVTYWQHVEIYCNGKKSVTDPDNKFPAERVDTCTDIEFYFAEKGKTECFDGTGGNGEGYNIGIDHCNGGGNQKWGVRRIPNEKTPDPWNAARAFSIKPKKQENNCLTSLPDGSVKLRACGTVNITEKMYVLNGGRIINTTPGKECLGAEFRSSACVAKNPLITTATMSVEALTGAGWKITDQGLLLNKYGECLTVSGDTVVKANCGNRDDQIWNIINASEGDVSALKAARSNAAATTLLAPLPSETPPSTAGSRPAFSFRSKINTDYCVDMAGGVAGAANLYWCNGGTPQQLLYNYAGPNTFAVADQQGKAMCLTANGAKKPLSFIACNGSAQQIWTVTGNEDTTALRNPEIDQCLDLADGKAVNGTPLYAWDCHGRANQQWAAVRVMSYFAETFRAPAPTAAAAPTSFANIKLQTNHPAPNAMCIDIDRANDKSPLLWQCHGEYNQRFTIDTAKSAVRYKDRCMTMVALPAAQSEGGQLAAISFNACDNSVAQRWTATAQGQLKHDSGKCADISKMRNDNGAPIVAWPCTNGSNQSWKPAP